MGVFSFFKNFMSKTEASKKTAVSPLLVKAQELINTHKIPGMAIRVLKKGEVVIDAGLGYANLETKTIPNTEKSLFRIASVSKPIAAIALAQMVRDQLINLDDSIYTYVPYFPKKKYDITIRQLASHTAGIRGYRGAEYALNIPYTIKEGIGVFGEDELLFAPGSNYHYNSYDWCLLSLAMQEVSGAPFQDYVAKWVLKPLGLLNTTPEIKTNTYPDLVSFYSRSKLGFRKATLVNNFYKLAGGGYLATAADVAKLGQAVLEGKVLGDAIGKTFLTAQRIDDTSTFYGLGWQVSEDAKARPYYGHVGNGVGGYAVFYVYPKEEMVFSILINCTHPKIENELAALVEDIIMGV